MIESKQQQIWLEKAQEGDPLAVAGLLAAHYPMLRARAETRMSPALKAKVDPEDILQEVYLDAFRQMDHFENRGPGSFVNWILTILDNKLMDTGRALRRQKRDIAREVSRRVAGDTESYWNLIDQVYTDSATPSRVARREEAVGGLLACMGRLPDPDRQVIQMRFLEGRSVREIAARLGKSQTTIVAVTKRPLNALRASMDCLGEFTHGA